LLAGAPAVDHLAAFGAQRPFVAHSHEHHISARIETGRENDLG
jgi:hypothetical protein